MEHLPGLDEPPQTYELVSSRASGFDGGLRYTRAIKWSYG